MPESSSDSTDPLRRFARTVDFLGDEGFARLRRACVAIFGLGGVGSHAAVALARSGIGTLRLIDFDDVTLTSLNRSAMATPADVGRAKTDVLAAHLHSLAPDTRVDVQAAFFHNDTADALLAPGLDLVIDAIDSEGPKVALLSECVARGIAVVSSMGAAARNDPSQIRVADLMDTSNCPLARNVRHKLRRAGIGRGITAVYSTEPVRPSLPPDDVDPRFDRGRVRRRLPSLITVPGTVGYTLAAVAIERLAVP